MEKTSYSSFSARVPISSLSRYNVRDNFFNSDEQLLIHFEHHFRNLLCNERSTCCWFLRSIIHIFEPPNAQQVCRYTLILAFTVRSQRLLVFRIIFRHVFCNLFVLHMRIASINIRCQIRQAD